MAVESNNIASTLDDGESVTYLVSTEIHDAVRIEITGTGQPYDVDIQAGASRNLSDHTTVLPLGAETFTDTDTHYLGTETLDEYVSVIITNNAGQTEDFTGSIARHEEGAEVETAQEFITNPTDNRSMVFRDGRTISDTERETIRELTGGIVSASLTDLEGSGLSVSGGGALDVGNLGSGSIGQNAIGTSELDESQSYTFTNVQEIQQTPGAGSADFLRLINGDNSDQWVHHLDGSDRFVRQVVDDTGPTTRDLWRVDPSVAAQVDMLATLNFPNITGTPTMASHDHSEGGMAAVGAVANNVVGTGALDETAAFDFSSRITFSGGVTDASGTDIDDFTGSNLSVSGGTLNAAGGSTRIDKGTITLSTGSTPAFDGIIEGVTSQEDVVIEDVNIYPDSTGQVAADYDYNKEWGRQWDNSTGKVDINLTVNWDNDPGSNLTMRVEVVTL